MNISLKEKFKLIFTPDYINRITFSETPFGEKQVTLELHGLKCREAKQFVNNLINLIHSSFSLKLIHGFNHGKAIKNMLIESFENPYVINRCSDPCNMGVTYMQIMVN